MAGIFDDILKDLLAGDTRPKIDPKHLEADYFKRTNPNPHSSVRAPITDIEYEVDMQPALNDSLAQLGYLSVGAGGWNTGSLDQDEYQPGTNRIYIDPKPGDLGREIQAHEYRHGGINRVIDALLEDPASFRELYGDEATDHMWEVLKDENRDNERLTETFENNVPGLEPYLDNYMARAVKEYMDNGPQGFLDRGYKPEGVATIERLAKGSQAVERAAGQLLILDKQARRKKMDPANDPKIVYEGMRQPLNSGYEDGEYKYADGGRVGGSSILNLEPDAFMSALDELGLAGEERDFLVGQYRNNMPSGKLKEALGVGPGMKRRTILPIATPEGMTGLEAMMSGQFEWAMPELLSSFYEIPAEGVSATEAMLSGIPVSEQELESTASGIAGLGVGQQGIRYGLKAGSRVLDKAQRSQFERFYQENVEPNFDTRLEPYGSAYIRSPDEKAAIARSGPRDVDIEFDQAVSAAEAMRELGIPEATITARTGIQFVPINDLEGNLIREYPAAVSWPGEALLNNTALDEVFAGNPQNLREVLTPPQTLSELRPAPYNITNREGDWGPSQVIEGERPTLLERLKDPRGEIFPKYPLGSAQASTGTIRMYGPEINRRAERSKYTPEDLAENVLKHEAEHINIANAGVPRVEVGASPEGMRAVKKENIRAIVANLKALEKMPLEADVKGEVRLRLLNQKAAVNKTTSMEDYYLHPGEMLARSAEGQPGQVQKRLSPTEAMNPYIRPNSGLIPRYGGGILTALASETGPVSRTILGRKGFDAYTPVPANLSNTRVPNYVTNLRQLEKEARINLAEEPIPF
jgi:hypothetical protein